MEVKMENSRIFRRSKDVPRFTRIEVLESKARHLNVMIFVLIKGSSADIWRRGKKKSKLLRNYFRFFVKSLVITGKIFMYLYHSSLLLCRARAATRNLLSPKLKFVKSTSSSLVFNITFTNFLSKKVEIAHTVHRREISSYAKISWK